MILTHTLCKIYNQGKDNEVNALKNVSIFIRKGDMVAIKGTSGAGKSTLLHILGCLDKPSSGKYLLEGEDITGASSKRIAHIRNSKIGFVLQDYALIEDETVADNIATPVYFSKIKLRQVEARILELAEQMNIHGLLNHRVGNLSGGEKQRVAIARALINNPEIILADEPTGSLDSANSQAVMDIFHYLNDMGRTIVIITHDDEIASSCGRTITISDGMVISNKEHKND